ncbi:MAG: hypothetical protein DBX05_05175 [Candidatus Poseidoniales archaeon]|nr:MAG: hypothetical protein DBX05_05175 [Candidatus Poseidoniales archaeon]
MANNPPIEIERKHLAYLPLDIGHDATYIRQWYLPVEMIDIDDGLTLMGRRVPQQPHQEEWISGIIEIIKQANPTIRVRITDDCAILCIKGKTVGIERPEFEWVLSDPSWFEQQLSTSKWPLVEKQRWEITAEDGHVWELDSFMGANEGLVLAEIELIDANERYTAPDWVGEDVSNDLRLSNQQLANNPFTRWEPSMRVSLECRFKYPD